MLSRICAADDWRVDSGAGDCECVREALRGQRLSERVVRRGHESVLGLDGRGRGRLGAGDHEGRKVQPKLEKTLFFKNNVC